MPNINYPNNPIIGQTATYSNGNYVIWDGYSWRSATSSISGTQGPQGLTGNSGNQGSTGTAGSNGNQGSTGTAGANGNQGSTGPQGSTGTAGSNGNQGSTGPQGPTGTAGSNGNQGSTGPQGSTGTAGSNGNQGSTGFQGNTGVQGSTGIQGSAGATGTSLGVEFNINGNSAVIQTTVTGTKPMTGSRTFTKWIIRGWANNDGTGSGSITLTLAKNGTSMIGAGNAPTLSSAQSNSATISGWTSTSVAEGDTLVIGVSSVSSLIGCSVIFY